MEILLSHVWFGIAGYLLSIYTNKKSKAYERSLNEKLVSDKLREVLEIPEISSFVIDNITLELSDGDTTQIDHLVITSHGVIVIESKHYSGVIYANAKGRKWTQYLRKKEYKFQNPIRQNYKHIKAIENLFEFIPAEYIQGLVVFSGNAEFKTSIPEGVCLLERLQFSLPLASERVISENRLEFCVGRTTVRRLPESEETDSLHVTNLKRNLSPWGSRDFPL